MADNCTDHPEWTDCWENWVQDYIDDNTYTIGGVRFTLYSDDKLAEYEEWSKEYCADEVVNCTYPDAPPEISSNCDTLPEFESCWVDTIKLYLDTYETWTYDPTKTEEDLQGLRDGYDELVEMAHDDCASEHSCNILDYDTTYCDLYPEECGCGTECKEWLPCDMWPDYCDEDAISSTTGGLADDAMADEEGEEAPPSGYEYWYLIYPNTSTIGITKNELISSDSFALKTGLYSAITADDNIWDAALLRTGVADATEQAIISGLDFDLDIDATLLSDPDIKGITPFKVATSVSEDAFVVGWAYGNTKRPKFTFDSSIDLSEIYNVAYRGDTFKSTFSRYDDGVSFQNKHEDFINKLAKSVGLADSSVSIRNFKKVKRNQIDYKKLSIFDDIDTSTTVSTTVATSVTTGGGY